MSLANAAQTLHQHCKRGVHDCHKLTHGASGQPTAVELRHCQSQSAQPQAMLEALCYLAPWWQHERICARMLAIRELCKPRSSCLRTAERNIPQALPEPERSGSGSACSIAHPAA